jgi:hypothetical protein
VGLGSAISLWQAKEFSAVGSSFCNRLARCLNRNGPRRIANARIWRELSGIVLRSRSCFGLTFVGFSRLSFNVGRVRGCRRWSDLSVGSFFARRLRGRRCGWQSARALFLLQLHKALIDALAEVILHLLQVSECNRNGGPFGAICAALADQHFQGGANKANASPSLKDKDGTCGTRLIAPPTDGLLEESLKEFRPHLVKDSGSVTLFINQAGKPMETNQVTHDPTRTGKPNT